MLPSHVAFFGCSATLDNNDLKKIIKSAGFRNPLEITTPLDRPDITYTIVPMPSNSKTTFLALSALLPEMPEEGWDDTDRPFQCTNAKYHTDLKPSSQR
jgi:superfamily II DNA helicase RecQ